MANQNRPDSADEPIGIVISRGKRDEPAPMFWAYVWAPAPALEDAATEAKAA